MKDKKAQTSVLLIVMTPLLVFIIILIIFSTITMNKTADINEEKYGLRIDDSEAKCLEFCEPFDYYYDYNVGGLFSSSKSICECHSINKRVQA